MIKTLSKRMYPFTHNYIRKYSLFKLPEEHLMLKNICRHFVDTELKPIASDLDKTGKFPHDKIKKIGELGLMGINVSEKYGGTGLDYLALAIVVEEISRGCGGTGTTVSVHNSLYAKLLDKFGTDGQKEQFLRPFMKGKIGCFALSEADAGSDVASIKTTAKKDGDSYILNGTKAWVTNGSYGKAAIVFATVDRSLRHKGITAFLVPIPSPGLSLGKEEDKMGIRACSTCDIILEDVRVPAENIVGTIGGGFKLAMEQLDGGRIGIAAQALGIAQAALECAYDYANKRQAFGKSIIHFQAIKLKLAEMATKLEAARLMVWRAAVAKDTQTRSTKESSMAKLMASETATFVTFHCVQILGAMGYVKSMPAERHYRDARITEIYGGITDIQKLVIADAVNKEFGYSTHDI